LCPIVCLSTSTVGEDQQVAARADTFYSVM
jgi:hypothetical protein